MEQTLPSQIDLVFISIRPIFSGAFASADKTISNVSDLAGYRWFNSRYVEDLELTVAPDGAEIVRFGDNAATQSAFISGQIDVIVTGNTVAAQM